MDIPLSDTFLNRVVIEHQTGVYTYQEQVKAVYTALRHTCFYKNITRFIFDHFVDKQFVNDLTQQQSSAKVTFSMIYISNYQTTEYNRTRDQTMCLRRQPYSRKFCRERGCMEDYRNHLLHSSCIEQAPPLNDCEQYCQCKYQCIHQNEQVVLLTPILKGDELVERFERYFPNRKHLSKYQDEFIKLIALNLAHIRERAAMARINQGKPIRIVINRMNTSDTLLTCLFVRFLSMFRYFSYSPSNYLNYWYHCSLLA
jgi:hypothetical protein